MLREKESIADAKLAEVVPLVQVIIPTATTEEVRRFCLSKRGEGCRRWMETALPREIALWVISNL